MRTVVFQKSEICSPGMYPARIGKFIAKFGMDTEQTGEIIVNIAVSLPVGELEGNPGPQTDLTKIHKVLKYVEFTTRLLEQNRI
jgi:hypothetical protein